MPLTPLDNRDDDAESFGFSRRCASLLWINMAEISILVGFCAVPHARHSHFLSGTTFCTFLILLCGMGFLVYRSLIKHSLEATRDRRWYEAGRRDRNEITKYEFNETLKHSVDHELRLLPTLWGFGEFGMQSSFLGIAAFLFWALCVVAVGA